VCLVMTGVQGAEAARKVGLADEANNLDETGALSEAAKRRINPIVIVREMLDVGTKQSALLCLWLCHHQSRTAYYVTPCRFGTDVKSQKILILKLYHF
jgi:hypothetical protein